MNWADAYCTPQPSIMEQVCREHGVNHAELVSSSRSKHLVQARHEAMRQMYQMGMPQTEIASIFHRHHSTVSYAISKEK